MWASAVHPGTTRKKAVEKRALPQRPERNLAEHKAGTCARRQTRTHSRRSLTRRVSTARAQRRAKGPARGGPMSSMDGSPGRSAAGIRTGPSAMQPPAGEMPQAGGSGALGLRREESRARVSSGLRCGTGNRVQCPEQRAAASPTRRARGRRGSQRRGHPGRGGEVRVGETTLWGRRGACSYPLTVTGRQTQAPPVGKGGRPRHKPLGA